METQVPADGGGGPAPMPTTLAAEDVETRLAAVEHRLDALEGSIREAVTQELQAAGEEMRRAVSELGRLLLRDLDRLTKVLAEHRDAIVERVTAALAPAAPAGSAEEPADAAAQDATKAAPAALTGEQGRWRVLPRRTRRA
ncbi:MAG: hypothetical protein LC792_16130 [Actinobacteria bacterium]|nr:hypothetical protein [Actinomycetota bacterium]